MNEIVKAIESRDWHALELAFFDLPKTSGMSIRDLVEILEILPAIVVTFSEPFTIEYKREKITWHRYETLIWQLGEAFRQTLKQRKAFRRDPNLFRVVEKICLDTQFGKGRESFVMLLGQYGDANVIHILQKLLTDKEVQGHAVYALRLLGASEVQEDVRPFLQSSKTWVRNEAKKYFQKIAK